ncbi:hypothetical protein Aazo_4084 ['Nostoc azollae' 0708]|jgi:hypothetical protein|uniref:Uncharacterized protein n=1 Tax=Nostoc azollae (strain 0708) TaxID=551115 RepID=D7E5H3_NOSA0|nr:hypothetical protein Aazo_4084 ['Nostoc azollae' 0708]
MPFQKNHKTGFTTNREKPLTSSPICFRVDKDLARELKSIPDWQEELRLELPNLI